MMNEHFEIGVIVAHSNGCAAWSESFNKEKRGTESAVNLDFVSDHGPFFVAHGFDVGDGKAAVAQVGKGALQRLVQFVLKSGCLFGRSENACIDAIFLAMTIVGEKD